MKISDFEKTLVLVNKKVELDRNWKCEDADINLAFEWLINEIKEAEEEYVEGKKVYLEDELWDVIWCFLRIVNMLNRDGKINSQRIFERAIKKYSQRMEWIDENTSWEERKRQWREVKKIQKAELKQEQEKSEK